MFIMERSTLSRKRKEGTIQKNRKIRLYVFLWLTIWSIGVAILLVLVVKSWMDVSIVSCFIQS